MRIFGSVKPASESIFPFFYIVIFQRWYLSSPLPPLCWEIDICARGLFCSKFNLEQHLFEPFFDASVFLAASSPKVNLLTCFSILYFKDGYLSSPLASFWGRGLVDICARGLFCTKFNYKQPLLEAFFYAMCIFGSI